MIQDIFFKKLALTAATLFLTASSIWAVCGAWIFAWGILTAGAWIFLNSYFLFSLVQIGFQPKQRMSDKILLFSILKFPVLYVVGFFILKTRFFPVYSILTGLTIFMAAFILCWVRYNLSAGAASIAGEGQAQR